MKPITKNEFTARRDLIIVGVGVLLMILLGPISVYLNLKILGQIVFVPLALFTGFHWLRAGWFRCPRCSSPWPKGLASHCSSCGIKYGDIDQVKVPNDHPSKLSNMYVSDLEDYPLFTLQQESSVKLLQFMPVFILVTSIYPLYNAGKYGELNLSNQHFQAFFMFLGIAIFCWFLGFILNVKWEFRRDGISRDRWLFNRRIRLNLSYSDIEWIKANSLGNVLRIKMKYRKLYIIQNLTVINPKMEEPFMAKIAEVLQRRKEQFDRAHSDQK